MPTAATVYPQPNGRRTRVGIQSGRLLERAPELRPALAVPEEIDSPTEALAPSWPTESRHCAGTRRLAF